MSNKRNFSSQSSSRWLHRLLRFADTCFLSLLLLERIEGGEALAKEMGIPLEKLKSTFADYNEIATGKKKCPWGKKFFSNHNMKTDDYYHVALMTPVSASCSETSERGGKMESD